jgi:hypothetical protein
MLKESVEQFKAWSEDLDLRAEAYAAEEMLKAPPKMLAAPKTGKDLISGSLPHVGHGDKICVVESTLSPGVWRVELNGTLIQTFAGDDAHARALKYVNDSLNQG